MITIGLAVLLVSAIPSYSSGGYTYSTGGMILQHSFVCSQSYLTLTPQQELYLNVTANQTLNVYILNVQWLDFLANQLNITGFGDPSSQNESILQTYLNSHQDIILKQTASSTDIITYTPDTIVNATVIVLNAADSNATVEYNYKINNIYAPAARLQQLAMVTLPLGLVFMVPGIFSFYKNRKLQKQLSNGK